MVELPEHLRAHLTDSAGQPWQGRTFSENPWADDDGQAPAALVTSIAELRDGTGSLVTVIDTLREVRVLIPLVAHLGEAGVNEAGQTVDKSADLSIVSVKAPDGRATLPVFSSIAAMQAWDPDARPVPIDVRKAALAAVSEGTQLMILDPGSETELAVRRPAVWAIAKDTPYELPWQHPTVQAVCSALLQEYEALQSIDLQPGDPQCNFAGPELMLELAVSESLPAEELKRVLTAVQQRFASDEAVLEIVDSLGIRIARIRDPQAAPETTGMSQQQRGNRPKLPPKAGLFARFRRR